MEILGFTTGQLSLWLLFLLRSLGFVVLAPLLSVRNAPPPYRFGFVLFLSSISFVAWAPKISDVPTGQSSFISMAIAELALGLMLGFLVGLVFVSFQFAGQFIGYQMGFAIVNVLDPHTQSQVSLIGEFLFVIAMLSFLSLNLHHDVIGVWYQSYELAPPGSWALSNFELSAVAGSFTDMVGLAMKVALPLLSFLILTDLSLGILARIMPQMNVFIVGMPLKIAMGMFFLSLMVLQLDPVIRQATYKFINHAGELLVKLAGA